jgi:FkbM family methyltransferase
MKNALIALGRRLPARVRNAVFHYGYNIAGDEFDRFAFLYSGGHEVHLRALAANGVAPRLIVDIGANSGEWTRTALSIWPEARAIMVEPNALHAGALGTLAGELNATVSSDLLGAEDGREVDFHVMQAGTATGSSVFPERSDVARTIERRRLRSLDSLLAGEPADLLKIDTQGYELEILAGAARSLPAAKAVILETSLIEVNEACPILHEVVAYMHERGFVAFDVLEMHRRRTDATLLQIDILFCPISSPLRANLRFTG